MLVVLGLFGVPVSRAWWRRLVAAGGGDRVRRPRRLPGGRAPCAGVFLLLFLPLTAPVTAPLNLSAADLARSTMTPVRWWRWLTGRQAATAQLRTVIPEFAPANIGTHGQV